MKQLILKHSLRAFSMGLRLLALSTKLLLTLYIARYLGLADMGNYGLVAGTVFILMVVLGVRMDYMVARELVGATPYNALVVMRNQGVFYILNQCLLTVVMTLLYLFNVTGLTPHLMIIIVVLSSLENWGDTIFFNFISLGRPMAANILFFVRTAFWVFPVVGLGLLDPQFRNIQVVFTAWILGGVVSFLLAFFFWRHMPWLEVFRTPVDWGWLRKSIKRCFFIWVGTIGGIGGMYLDRFVIAQNMSMSMVGVGTFYSSFGGAMYALIYSGVLSFTYPHLIALHKSEDKTAYNREARKLGINVAILAAIIGLGIGFAVPPMGLFFGRPELAKQAATLWLILVGTWMRCNSGTLYYVLFSRHQDTALWLGDLLFLAFSFVSNIILVPRVGFIGVGYSAIISGLFQFLWRGWHVYRNNDKKVSVST
jgi:O-antigen/teichoic acid export membrane protein